MKLKNILPALLMACLGLSLGLTTTGCSDKFPTNVESPDKAELLGLKIINAGKNGDQVVEGVVDDFSKTISFPRIDPETDLSALKFEAKMAPGGALDKETYTVEVPEGSDRQTIIVKVVNGKHFREYFATIRLLVPVYGADFDKTKIHDYTAATLKDSHPEYNGFGGLVTRGAGMSEKWVVVPARSSVGAHVFRTEDLLTGKFDPIKLNTEGISGGIFPINMAEVIGDHIYISNLAGALNAKVYHWTDPSKAPDLLLKFDANKIEGGGKRYFDNFSITLDEQGNGYIYTGDNAQTNILRFPVKDFTKADADACSVLSSHKGQSPYVTMLRAGNSKYYLLNGFEMPLKVTDAEGNALYTTGTTTLPVNLQSSRVVYFNGERYLIGVTAARRGEQSPVLMVYNITQGKDELEGIKILDESGQKPLLEVSLQGTTNAAPGTNTGYFIKKDMDGKDATLYLFGFHSNAGFAIAEIPAKTLDD